MSTRETPVGRETGSHFIKSNQNVLTDNKLEGIHPNREVSKLEIRSNGAGSRGGCS